MDVRDSNGTLLADGDNVTLIKDLKVKGAGVTLDRGTLIRGIRLTDDPAEIECRAEKVRDLVLRVYPIDTDDLRVVAAARQFVTRALQAMTNVGGSQRPEVFEGPTERSIAVVARSSDLPRVEEAIKAALGK